MYIWGCELELASAEINVAVSVWERAEWGVCMHWGVSEGRGIENGNVEDEGGGSELPLAEGDGKSTCSHTFSSISRPAALSNVRKATVLNGKSAYNRQHCTNGLMSYLYEYGAELEIEAQLTLSSTGSSEHP